MSLVTPPLYRATALSKGAVSSRIYFFEEDPPAGSRNVRHIYKSPRRRKDSFHDMQPWEHPNASAFGGSIVPTDAGGYRLYYTTHAASFTTMSMAVAESDDGIDWRRPELGQVQLEGHDTNLIRLNNCPADQNQVGQPQVIRLRDGRWRMYYWHHHKGKGYDFQVAHSDDGLTWSLDDSPISVMNDHWLEGFATTHDGWSPDAVEGLSDAQRALLWSKKAARTNDATFVYYNDALDRFEYYAQWFITAIDDRRVAEDNCPGFLRYIQRRFSADGLTWSAPELIIQPDAKDPWDLQFYHLAVQWHEDWMIGSLGHYRVENDQQTMDLELCFSRDGKQWHRPARGGQAPRVYDPMHIGHEGIYPTNAWIDAGDCWRTIHTRTSKKHNQTLDAPGTSDASGNTIAKPVTSMRAVEFPKHRIVGLRADELPGMVMTPPFSMQSDDLRIDANVRGWIRAELCDVHGRKHPGFHLMNSEPYTGNSDGHVLRWKGQHVGRFKHDMLRLRLEFADADLYSIRV